MKKKRILVIFSGGTICKNIDKELGTKHKSGEENLAHISSLGLDNNIEIEIKLFSNIPGPQLTIENLLDLRRLILQSLDRKEINGIVITVGTDTLEETSYFIDLLLDNKKPVVFVGAMRNASQLGYDGACNLAAGIRVAASEKIQGSNVLVVLNNEINLASEVVKTDTSSLNSFKSPYGSIGLVNTDEIRIIRENPKGQYIETKKIEPRVDIIKTCFNMDDRLIRASVDSGAKGIVIESMGEGNIPQTLLSGIQYAISKGVIVVIVTRCHHGNIPKTHKDIEGVIWGTNMNGLKARIKLMLSLGHSNDIHDIVRIFDEKSING